MLMVELECRSDSEEPLVIGLIEGNNGSEKRLKFELETQLISRLFEPRIIEFIF